MKVQEFIDYMKKHTNNIMKEEQILSLVVNTIDVKPYLGIQAKKQLVDKIIEQCIYYDNGVYKFDGIDKYVYFTMYTIAAYTNLELDKDVENDFDLLSVSQLLPVVIAAMQQEYDEVNIYLQMQCDFILESNSLESIVGKFCNDIIDTLNAAEGKLAKYIDKIDIDKIVNSDLINTAINFLSNMQK